MNSEELLEKVGNLRVFKQGGERAPHKPLMLLIALQRLQAGQPRLILFSEVETPCANLLKEFGPFRKSYRPEYPFLRLQTDGIWEAQDENGALASNLDLSSTRLIEHRAAAGFSEAAFSLLKDNAVLQTRFIHLLLENNFPESLHVPILDAVGLSLTGQFAKHRRRDPRFRDQIILAYEAECAVCGFNVRIANTAVALEAAHIKWHSAGGPDTTRNGLALCSLHHTLFDLGIFTLKPNLEITVSDQIVDNLKSIRQFHDKPIKSPYKPEYAPDPGFILWHQSEVFKGDPPSGQNVA